MNIKTKKAKLEYLKLPCIEFKQNSTKLFFFIGNAKEMWSILKINRRIEDKDEGYQRTLSGSRVKSIAKYIEAGNTLPQSLLVSIDKGEILRKGKEIFLKIPKVSDAGWVIDGQHRLAGAHNAKVDFNLPFLAFIGLEVEEQVRLFVTINQEAKGVPSSLYLDLLKNLPNKKPLEIAKERAADIGTQIKKDEESPFYGRIVVTTSPKKGEISLTNFVRKVMPLIQPGKGILHVYNEIEQRGIFTNYFKGLKNVFPKEFNRNDSIFFQTLGFGALLNSLPTFFSVCYREYKGFTADDATKIFKKIEYFDFASWRAKGTGSSAEIEAGNDLITELNSMFEIGVEGAKTLRI